MFFILSKILAFLIKPTFWIFSLLSCAIIFKKQRKKILIITISLVYFFTNGFIADEFSRIWSIDRQTLTSKYDIGIVLGGISDFDQKTKTHNFNKHADRIMEAEQLYHQGFINKIMLSGGNGSLKNIEYSEADAMKQFLIKNNIPEEDIIIENKSRNTIENAIFSTKLLKEQYPNSKCLLITSASHMRRAELSFKKAGLHVTPFPTDCITSHRGTSFSYLFIPRVQALDQWETLIKEVAGYIVYSLTN